MATSAQAQPEAAHLDVLIQKLTSSGEAELLVEHLQTAHAYLHGAMPKECAHNLELARQAAGKLSAKVMQDEVKEIIASLLLTLESPPRTRHHGFHRPSASHAPSATARGLANFFHGTDVNFGIFYPKKHIVAVFPSFESAQAAHQALSDAGFLIPNIAVSGKEVLKFLEGIRAHRTLWESLMTEVSRLLGTEANLVDRYAALARDGYGFLVARSPAREAAEKISEFLEPMHPAAITWFMTGSILHLI